MSNSSFYSNTGITSADVSSITSSKEAAATSETNAATSATNAATSATQAATSATNAATSETNAATSATNAATSASSVGTSETNASASAATATTQASNAATSATAAAGSASAANTSKTNAASSETSAATSATNAATSATSAATSATSAGTSATNAATSETNAAASSSSASGYVTSATTQANNAATSATAAATSETNAATSATAASTSASGASTSASNANTSATNAASSASQAATSAAAAALAADNFDDTYLGSNSSDPTTDNDGDALNAGDLHFNTSSNTLKVYNGSAWQDAAVDSSGFVQTTGDTMTGALNVQSTITSDGLTVDASTTVIQKAGDNPILQFKGHAGSQDTIGEIQSGRAEFSGTNSFMRFKTNDGTSTKTRLNIDANGDISFYEDTGTTAKFFWDASAESLGIGTTSPDDMLDVENGNIRLRSNSDGNTGLFRMFDASGTEAAQIYGASGDLKIYSPNDVLFSQSGNVGIGTSSPDRPVHLSSDGTRNYFKAETTGSANSSESGFEIKTPSSNWLINSLGGTDALIFYDLGNTSEAMRISSDGDLELIQSNNLYWKHQGGGTIRAGITADSSDNLTFSTGSSDSTAMTIDGSGRVGIGSAPNSGWRNDIADQIVLMLGTEATLFSDAGVTTALINNAKINNGDAFVNISTRGASQYFQYEGAHKWYTAASASAGSNINTEMTSPKMTLDISGNLLVGKTALGIGTAGHMLAADGYTEFTRTATSTSTGSALNVGRNTHDGSLATFWKDGSTVGSIGTNSGYLKINSGNTSFGSGIEFHNLKALPVGANGASSNGTVSLGESGRAWKDLYLSGGVYLGGTGSANKLDDYEEGTHDITLNQGGVGINSSYVTWRYTKIGRMVYIEGLFLASSSGDTNVLIINLPFTYLAKSGNTADQIVQTVGAYQVPTGSGGIKGTITAGTSKLQFKKTVDNGVWTPLIGTDMASGDHLYVNLAYPTT